MKLRLSLIVAAFVLALSGCNFAVTSFPSATETPLPPVEVPPTPLPDTPAPAAIAGALIESPAFVEIHFLNERDGWGITETYIVRTNDGGITWHNVKPPDLPEIGSTVNTFILDRDHAWVQKPDFNNFPNNGLLYHTENGGLNWTISSTPFSAGDLSFLDANNGWMLADLGIGAGSNAVAVFQTTDGGATWIQRYTNDPNNPDASDSLPLGGIKSGIVPLDMQTAWVSGTVYSPGTVYLYRTDDGGRTWSPVEIELSASAEDYELSINRDQMQFVSATEGFLLLNMAGEETLSAVYVTSDAGDTWTLMPALFPYAGEADFISAQEAVLYAGEQFYVTRDAARTWVTVAPDIVFGDSFFTMEFVNPDHGWVVTMDPDSHRSLYRTQDGGATWLPVHP